MFDCAPQYRGHLPVGIAREAPLRKPMTIRLAGKELSAEAPIKDLYEIGEIPPLGHVPASMYAWAIRKERHGPPEQSMQVEVVPTWPLDSRRGAGLRDGGGRQLQRRLGRRSASRSRRSTCTSNPYPHRRLRRLRHRLGGRLARSSAGRSATKSSSTAIRTTATTRNATAATRCSRPRSASGATRRRTARSRSSAGCRTAS